MLRRSLVPLAVAALGLVACGGDDSGSADPTTSTTVDSAGDTGDLPACDDLYKEGAVVTPDQAEAGCVLADESILLGNTSECSDGRLLVTYEDTTPQIWGFAGEALHAAENGEYADDPGYSEAYGGC